MYLKDQSRFHLCTTSIRLYTKYYLKAWQIPTTMLTYTNKVSVVGGYMFIINQIQIQLSILDLGVGIFKSAHTKNYLEKILKFTGLQKNIDLVDDLLAGKIHSRIEKDREL